MNFPTGAQLRAARALLRLEKEQLAELSGVSSATIRKLEAVDGPVDARTVTLRALEGVLTRGGVEFRPDGSVRLREPAEVAR
jgi:predicted transcriptional regulator